VLDEGDVRWWTDASVGWDICGEGLPVSIIRRASIPEKVKDEDNLHLQLGHDAKTEMEIMMAGSRIVPRNYGKLIDRLAPKILDSSRSTRSRTLTDIKRVTMTASGGSSPPLDETVLHQEGSGYSEDEG
jgi:hypothetical protein